MHSDPVLLEGSGPSIFTNGRLQTEGTAAVRTFRGCGWRRALRQPSFIWLSTLSLLSKNGLPSSAAAMGPHASQAFSSVCATASSAPLACCAASKSRSARPDTGSRQAHFSR